MRKINLILLIFFCAIYACSSNDAKENDSKNKTKINFPEENLGSYISKVYINELENSGSTKKAQEKAYLSTAKIFQNDSNIMFSETWNFHEGGNVSFINMVNERQGFLLEESTKDTLFQIEILENNEVIVYDEKDRFYLTKNSKGFELVNSTILSGDFYFNNQKVEFQPSGNIKGLDSVISYQFHEDYYDAGMQVDMIYLTDKDSNIITYGYEINKSKFKIFTLKCDLYQDDYCVERSKDNLLYEFERRNIE